MKPIAVGLLAEQLGGRLFGLGGDELISSFVTDNREAKAGSLFIAIEGHRVDGHDFTAAAIEAGAVASVVQKPSEGPQILVDNVANALARMASVYRNRFTGPVVGITGSAGKTTTKELTAAALSSLGSILKTSGNRNTEWTTPLLWAEMAGTEAAAVVEMSMRGPGQIAHLASFTRPTIGLITNIGYSHIEHLGSREAIASAKGELLEALPPDCLALLWQEDEFLETLRRLAPGPVATFGLTAAADSHISDYQALSWSRCLVSGIVRGQDWSAELPFVGRSLAVNAAAAILVAVELGVHASVAAASIQEVTLPPMRMEVHELDGVTILLDAYNASPASMLAAIETLGELPASGRKIAMIGEMRELGEFSESAHRSIGRALALADLDEVVLFGAETRFAAEEVSATTASTHEELSRILGQCRPGDVVLIKGSRGLEMERVLLAGDLKLRSTNSL